jgi:ribonuclease HI
MKMAVAYIDGASRGNPGKASYGVLIEIDGEKYTLKKNLGISTNNVAEYEALLALLKWSEENKIDFLKVFSDSKLLVEQIKGNFKVKSENLKKLHKEAIEKIKKIKNFKIYYIRREFNKEADKIANKCLDEN